MMSGKTVEGVIERRGAHVIQRAVAAAAVLALAACTQGGQPAARPAPPTPSVTGKDAVAVTPAPSPTASPLFTLPGFLVLSAPAPGTVWVLANGDFLFISTDRGATWSRRTLPAEHAMDISFISEREGWVEFFDGAHTLTFWRTTDGAQTWSLARTIADLQTGESPGPVTLLGNGRAIFSTRHADAVAGVFRTADGGATWARSAALPVTEPVGRVVASGSLLLAAAGPHVITSADGGATWTLAGSTPDGRPATGVASATHWVEAPYGVATDDGGRTWHPWATTYQQAAGVAPDLVFAGPATVYVTVRGGLQRSDDDGATWTPLRTPGT